MLEQPLVLLVEGRRDVFEPICVQAMLVEARIDVEGLTAIPHMREELVGHFGGLRLPTQPFRPRPAQICKMLPEQSAG